MSKIVDISFTEEMVMNYHSLPEEMKGFRYYRAELWFEGMPYPIEEGHLWLPPDIDISALEDFLNEPK